MERLPACPLLKSGRNGLVCLGGVNFFAVGEDRALCYHCELLARGRVSELLSCKHLDVYTYLTYEEKHPEVHAIFRCDLPATASAKKRCVTCPVGEFPAQEQEMSV